MTKRKVRETYDCECIDCGYTMSSDEHCVDIKCPECGGEMRRASRPGPGRDLFKHNSDIDPREPRWSSIDQKKLPEKAFVDGKFPHHWVKGGKVVGRRDNSGKYNSGKLFLSKSGLIEALARAGDNNDHLNQHRKEIGLDKELEMKRNNFRARETNLGDLGFDITRNNRLAVDDSDGDRISTEIINQECRSGEFITDHELDSINRISQDTLTRDDVFVFPMWISNELQDAYSTRMARSSLDNYVSDLTSGRALQLAHGGGMFGGGALDMPIGSSFGGELTTREGYEGLHVLGHYYILRGLNTGLGTMTTDDIEKNIRGGVYRRGSIGFSIAPMEGRKAGRYICSICRMNILSGDCPHLPGIEYETEDGDKVLCVAEVHGAGMRESSLVPMNAAQGTIVNKAREFAAGGKLSKKNALALEYVYGTRVLDKPVISTPPIANEPVVNPKREEKETMEELIKFIRGLSDIFPALKLEDRKVEDAKDVAAVRQEIADALAASTADVSDKLALVESIPEELRSEEAIAQLFVEAEAGRTYKSDLVGQAVKEGIRANGNEFDEKHWRAYLTEQTDLEVIKASAESFRKTADANLDPGQKSRTEDNVPTSTAKVHVVPAEAYKVG